MAIVGGGWAGLACAVELAAHGQAVSLFEAAKQLGGRARRVEWQGLAIDNGQHLLIGAYHETLRLLRLLSSDALLERRPLEFDQPPRFRLVLPKLPAPWHVAIGLAGARGLSWRDKLAAARFIHALKRQDYRLPADGPVRALLDRYGQTEALRRHLWEPICLAALNTPMAAASAQVFCHVLRDSLGGGRADSDLLLPRADLGRIFPDAAAAYLQAQGSQVRIEARIDGIEQHGQGFRLTGQTEVFSHVVCATHPAQLPGLLAALPELEPVTRLLADYAYQPIETLWLRFAEPLPCARPMLGLDDGPGQWLFERADLASGLASVVISAEGPHLEMSKPALLEAVLGQLRQALGPLPALRDHLSIVEKRATFAATPAMRRPGNATALPGLYLAGDHTQSDYPATLEGAVRSGVACARLILAEAETLR
ncbi:MAG: FAD-dependent oxidoreductase [Hydrogenophilaceae bacterium]|nr:FAD-dependent oxidoreductase [Hydrogenophilaceae bacterium]